MRVSRPERSGKDDDAPRPVRALSPHEWASAHPGTRRAASWTATGSTRPAASGTSCRLAAARAGKADADIDAALAEANLEHAADKTVGACSHGTRRRLSLAAALIAEPDVLLLDEPASGLDPHALRALRERLQRHARTGGTVLLSSHVLEDVAATCDRVVVVNRGKRVAEGDLQALLAQRIRLRSPEPEQLLQALEGLDATRTGPDTVIVEGADADTVGRAVRGVILHEMSTQGALEALYVGLTEAS